MAIVSGVITVEISQVRKRLQAAITTARDRAKQRRQKSDEAEQAYMAFLEYRAGPLARQIVNALRAEGYSFTVSTPGRGLRLSLDQGRDDFIELALNTDTDQPYIVGRIRRTRGSRTLDDERAVKPGAPPQDVSESDLLEFFARALEPWLER
jgi:hypothetical protein